MSKPTENSLSLCLMELPPGPIFKQNNESSKPQEPRQVGKADNRNRSKLLINSLSRCMVELPPKPVIKQSKNKSEPQASGLAGGIDISNLSMMLELSLPRLSRELPPKSNAAQNKLTYGMSSITIRVGRTCCEGKEHDIRTSSNKRLSEMSVGGEAAVPPRP